MSVLDRIVQIASVVAIAEVVYDKHVERKRRDRQEESDRRAREMEERISRLENKGSEK
jgi:hypothetical protein